MTETPSSSIQLQEGRFARLEAIAWWNQALLGRSRVLVIGAGALGNEVVKNLALLGMGRMAIADMDRIERSNLSRSVLFRAADEGQMKAQAAARAARDIYPGTRATALCGNILADVGLGWFRWAQVVVGALDNREARVFVNSACARVGRPWVDGGIDVLSGIVRGFDPPRTACYECTMGEADWKLLEQRRSCSLLARKAFARGGTPTTPTTASVIGAIQAQEVVKRLHGLECLSGAGYVFEGRNHNSYNVSYPISPECPWHEEQPEIVEAKHWSSQTPLREIADWAGERLGGLDAIDFSRELVEALECPACGKSEQVLRPLDALTEEQALCPHCRAERVPRFLHSLEAGSPLLDLTPREVGLPAWDVLWARKGEAAVGIELAGDRPAELKDENATD